MNSTPSRAWTDEEFNEIARVAANQQPSSKAKSAAESDFLHLKTWGAENPSLYNQIGNSNYQATPDDIEIAQRWQKSNPRLYQDLVESFQLAKPASVAPPLDKQTLWIAGGVLVLIALVAIALFAGFTTASNPKPSKTVASKNIEIDSSYIPSDESLQEVVRTPTANPNPAVQTVGNATVVIPEEYDCLTVRNSDGLGIGFVYDGDRVRVTKDDGGDRVTIKTPVLTGSVVRGGVKRDG